MFKITVDDSTVMLTYAMNGSFPTLSELREIVNNVKSKTGIEFAIIGEPWQLNNWPLLNCYVFCNRPSYTFKWNILDEANRNNFIKALQILESELKRVGFLVDNPIEKIIQDAFDERTETPLISIGNKTYKMELRELSAPFNIEDQIKQTITDTLTAKDVECQTAIASITQKLQAEIKELQQTNNKPYPLNREDFFDGWRTWMRDGRPILGKQFIYKPEYITDGRNTYKIKPEISKKWSTKGIMAYCNDGRFYIYRHNGNNLLTHHTRSEGHLCTGDLSVSSRLDYVHAREIVLKMIEMMKVIYIQSTTRRYLSNDDISITSTNFKDFCEPLEIEYVTNQNRTNYSDPEILTVRNTCATGTTLINDGEML